MKQATLPADKARGSRRAALLRRVRLRLQWPQTRMAQLMRVDPATISQWETGAIPLLDYRLLQLEALLGREEGLPLSDELREELLRDIREA